ncbi:urease subunit alpha [Streptomyces marispadix]|uniref:Urease subunit alpha n=1 Tax=Streptomyces marispadix TaxID=2922868 RepID=A0ABS9T1W4_9ACTN|nr:urease subunit alpha [Streptomyces marispadix]MCH6162504.1 urease subunit alpha [Streptomyces marispadix]
MSGERTPAQVDRRTYNALYGPTTGDRIRLGDTGLWVEVETDDGTPGDELLGGCGKTVRDGLLASPRSDRDSALDMVVTNVVLLDPRLGVRKTDIGVKDGRVVAVGGVGNPDVAPVDFAVDSHTSMVPGEGLIATPGIVDSHVHLSSPEIAPAALSSGVTTVVGMGLGGMWEIGCNPARNLHTLMSAWRGTPLNVAFLARGSSSSRRLLDEIVLAGAGGFKIHEDFGATPRIVDNCLDAAEQADLPVALHTDSMNESGYLRDTVGATRGRTVHAYHVEGGGGHPDLLEILSEPNILPSSTTPTVPYTVNTVDELFPMTMTVHRQNHHIDSDVEVSKGRIRAHAIAAENSLHDLGAISIVNSDSMGMGRIAETVRRTWQLAHLQAVRNGESGVEHSANARVLRYLAKITLNPAVAHGISHDVGSVAPGRLADIVLWHPAWFGTKPELVIKGGFVAWGNTGSGSGSTRLTQPRTYRPYYGALGDAASRLSRVFIGAEALADADARNSLPPGLSYAPVQDSRGLGRNDMLHNTATPRVEVPRSAGPVLVDGAPTATGAATEVPLARLHHLA